MPFEELLLITRTLYAHTLFPVVFTDASLRICWANSEAVLQIPLAIDEQGAYRWPDFFRKAEVLKAPQEKQPCEMDTEGRYSLLFLPLTDESGLVAYQVLGKIKGTAPGRHLSMENQRSLLALYEKGNKMPLTIIFSTLGLLAREAKGNAVVTNYLKLTAQNAYRMLRFTENLAETFRLYFGFGDLALQNGDLCHFIQRLCEAANKLTAPTGIPISCQIPDIPVFTAFDPVRLRSALLNLISNSCRYTREGNHVQVKLEIKEERIVVSVADRGAGMDEATLSAVLSPDFFAAVHPDPAGGSGLGLALLKIIVEKHGGTLAIDSREGEGTRVAFTLPLRKDDTAPDYMAQESTHYLKNRFSPLYIELADVCDVPMP